MKLYSKGDNFKLYEGNMLEMLDAIAPASVDAVVTDPPYELNFMNKGWDNAADHDPNEFYGYEPVNGQMSIFDIIEGGNE